MSKGHTWRKLRLYIDESTGEIFVAEVTANDYHDSEKLSSLMEGIVDEVSQVSEDGDYDTFGCHDAIQKRSAIANIPLRKDAQPYGLAPSSGPNSAAD